jgi:hypothetical protein
MEKITIKNFGPIEDAEIEIRKVLVLIGEQATGKSTIAKLVYFFKTIGDELFANFLDAEKPSPDIYEIISIVKRRFYLFFGSTKHVGKFNVKYEFAQNVCLSVTNDSKHKTLLLDFSKPLKEKLINDLIAFAKKDLIDLRADLLVTRSTVGANTLNAQIDAQIKKLYNLITGPFGQSFESSLYIPAGRESTVSYPLVFKAYMGGQLSEEIEKRRKSEGQLDGQASDEILMLSFLQEVRKIKGYFTKYGGLDGIRDYYQSSPEIAAISQQDFEFFAQRFTSILKGKLGIDDFGEYLTVNDQGTKVYITDASSGQKESIRILQDVYLSISQGLTTFRVIEEPEAHLFPIAQKQLIELLVFLANAQSESQVIITTHSPYVLAVLNNLLMAKRISLEMPILTARIADIIPSKFQLGRDDLAVYSMGISKENNNPDSEGGSGHSAFEITNLKTGLIQQNYLDKASEVIGSEFQTLIDLYLKAKKQQA